MSVDSPTALDPTRAEDTFQRQHDQSDCGVACLVSVIRYFGGDARLERLREMSGTTKQGTTLLGLYQACDDLDLEAGAFEADMENLLDLDEPCILHVIKDERLQHYVVCYGYDGTHLWIGDPASGVSKMTPDEIDEIWQSRALLLLEPGEDFETEEDRRSKRWSWLWSLVKQDVNILFLSAALGLVISILGLSGAIFSQKLIDNILPSESYVKLTVGLVLLGVLLLASNGLSYLRSRFLVRQTRDFNNRVISHFYGTLLTLPQPFFFNRKVGDLIARMNDTRRLQRAVTYVLGDRMIDALTLLVSAAFIFGYAWELGAIAMLSLPMYGLLAYLYHEPIVEGQQNVMQAHSANESNYVDTIGGMQTIKSSNKQSWFAQTTLKIYAFFQEQIYDLGRLGVRFSFWAQTGGTLLQLGVLSMASYLVLSGRLELGVLVAVFQMTSMLIPAARRVALTNVELQEARVAFDRMYEFTSVEPEYDPEEEAQKTSASPLHSVDVQDLSFRFPGREQLLKGVSFHLERGELVTLMGESGCGKSTLLHILERFYEPEEGRIVVNGSLDWHDISVPDWREVLQAVPQEVKIFNGTLVDNLCLGDPEEHAEALDAFMNETRLDRYFRNFPQGYATLLGEEGANISGGQKQLVGLARALYLDPEMLLLDEPTAAMDREMEQFAMELIEKTSDERLVVMATHRTQSAKFADRVYVISDGTVEAEGSPDALAEGDNLFARSLADRTLAEAATDGAG